MKIPKTILFVDDDPVMSKIMQTLFARTHYRLVSLDSVERAISQINFLMPDLIISDFEMPGLNGLDFRKFIRMSPEWKRTPFLFFTGCDEPIFRGEAASLETFVISKNSGLLELFTIVENELTQEKS